MFEEGVGEAGEPGGGGWREVIMFWGPGGKVIFGEGACLTDSLQWIWGLSDRDSSYPTELTGWNKQSKSHDFHHCVFRKRNIKPPSFKLIAKRTLGNHVKLKF